MHVLIHPDHLQSEDSDCIYNLMPLYVGFNYFYLNRMKCTFELDATKSCTIRFCKFVRKLIGKKILYASLYNFWAACDYTYRLYVQP